MIRTSTVSIIVGMLLLGITTVAGCGDKTSGSPTSSPNGWAVQGRTVLSTADGGATWVEKYELDGAWKAFPVDEKTCFVSTGSEYTRTTDGGTSWEAIGVPADPPVLWRQFVSANDGWGMQAIHNDGPYTSWAILHTADGGQSWDTQYPNATNSDAPENIYDMCFTDANHGWVAARQIDDIGSTGTLLNTLDGGKTWKEHLFGDGFSPSLVRFIDDRKGWVFGSNGASRVLMHTTDGGTTWNSYPLATQDSFDWSAQDLEVSNTGRIWITLVADADGSSGSDVSLMLRSDDEGQVFEEIVSSLDMGYFLSPTFVDDNRGWMYADTGQVLYHTTDGGNTWSIPMIEQGE